MTETPRTAERDSWRGLAGELSYIGIDYDETLTTADTCALVAACARSGRQDVAAAEEDWKALVSNHVAACAELHAMLPQEPLPCFDQRRFVQWLDEMLRFDVESNARLEDSRVLSGATLHGLQQIGRRVELQPSAPEVLSALSRAAVVVEVVSASWSSEMLEATLAKAVTGAKPPPVVANSMLPRSGRTEVPAQSHLSSATSDGLLTWRVRTALDKARLVADRRNLLGPPVAFIGDSTGDLGALVEADIGIVVGTNRRLREALSRFGISTASMQALKERIAFGEAEPWKQSAKTMLFVASSWADVGSVLLGSAAAG